MTSFRFTGLSWVLLLGFAVLLGPVAVQAQPSSSETPNSSETPSLDFATQLPGLATFGGGGDDSEQITLRAEFHVLRDTREGKISVTAEMAPHWHTYALSQPSGGPMASKLTVDESEIKLAGPFEPDRDPVSTTPADDRGQPIFKVPVLEHKDRVTWIAPIRLAENVDPNDAVLQIKYEGQVCEDNGVCIPIFGRKIEARFAGYYEPAVPTGEYRANNSHVLIRGHLEPKVATAGETVTLVLAAQPDARYHVYAFAEKDPKQGNKPTLIVLQKAAGWQVSRPTASTEPLPGVPGKSSEPYHEGAVEWHVRVQVPPDAQPGDYTLSGLMGYQVCQDTLCDPPTAIQFTANVSVGETGQAGRIPLTFAAHSYRDVADEAQRMQWASESGPSSEFDKPVLAYLCFAFLAGLVLNVLPCVLPVIGLKIMSFVNQAGESRWRIISLNLWYTVGMIFVFLAIATGAVVLRVFYAETLSWGGQFQHPGFSIPLAAVVFVFGLSLFGVWEIPIPGFVGAGKANDLASKEGPAGAFFKGVLATLLATPCSGPFLGVAVGFAVAAPIWLTYLAFTFMGLGMASPYLVIGFFPSLVKLLPKPGPWMETFKQLMGFLLMATVIWFFSFLEQKHIVPTMVLLMGLAIACWMIGRTPLTADVHIRIRNWAYGAFIAALIGLFAFRWLASPHELEWQAYSRATLDSHLAEGRTVLVDFTADW